MGFLPALAKLDVSRTTVQEFGGLNHGVRIGDGELAEAENLTADDFPALSVRKKNQSLATVSGCLGFIRHEGESWTVVESGETASVKRGDTTVDTGLTPGKKTFVRMGKRVVVFPDGRVYDPSSVAGESPRTGVGKIEIPEFETCALYCLALCTETGSLAPYGHKAPAYNEYGVLQIASTDTPAMENPPRDYVRIDFWIENSNPLTLLPGDVISMKEIGRIVMNAGGFVNGLLNGQYTVVTGGTVHEEFPYSPTCKQVFVVIQATEVDGPILASRLFENAFDVSTYSNVIIKRELPAMDFVCEHNNRLWGCSSAENNLYATAAGNPFAWSSFNGTALDSYAAAVGSPGDFTGCAEYGDSVLFFKEDLIHKITGSYPANFTLTTHRVPGVEAGSAGSLAIQGERLYYKGRGGVYVYSGTIPQLCSEALHLEGHQGASGGALGRKYYMSLGGDLYVYDERTGVWHMWPGVDVTDFSLDADAGQLCFLRGAAVEAIGGGGQDAGGIDWKLVTGRIGLESPDQKYLSKLQLRVELAPGSVARVSVQYNDGGWEEKFRIVSDSNRTFTIPLVLRRCDSLRLKLAGTGGATLYSITKTVEYGAEGGTERHGRIGR